MDKAKIRARVIARRMLLPKAEATQLSATIATRLLPLLRAKSVSSVHIYCSRLTAREVDTSIVVQQLLIDMPELSVTLGQAKANAPLLAGRFDVIIVPLVAFDDTLNRIGFGGGWYDRFLAGQPNALKIGLAYDLQRVAVIPAEPHDVPLDIIITESRTFSGTRDY